MITHAFRPNLMYEPSLRRAPDLGTNDYSFNDIPFLTTPPGVALFNGCNDYVTDSSCFAARSA